MISHLAGPQKVQNTIQIDDQQFSSIDRQSKAP